MAQSRRVERVAALVRKEMSQLLMNGVRDLRVTSAMITITDVEVSGDLQHCKIFVSVYGDETQKTEVLLGLEASEAFLKGELGRRLQMRRAPEVIFKLDKGMETGRSVLNILEKLEKERNQKNQTIRELQD